MSNSFPKSCSTSWCVYIFLTNQSWMTIFHSWSWRNEKLISMGREQKGTDVDQQFTLFCFQTVLNGILMATFTTRSFAKKKYCQPMYHKHTHCGKIQFLSINWIKIRKKMNKLLSTIFNWKPLYFWRKNWNGTQIRQLHGYQKWWIQKYHFCLKNWRYIYK